jgi:hypothetical protein
VYRSAATSGPTSGSAERTLRPAPLPPTSSGITWEVVGFQWSLDDARSGLMRGSQNSTWYEVRAVGGRYQSVDQRMPSSHTQLPSSLSHVSGPEDVPSERKSTYPPTDVDVGTVRRR